MLYPYPLEAREVLNQIVRDPRFKVLNTAPKFGFQVLLFSMLGLALFIGSTSAYLQGSLPYVLVILINGYAMVMMFTAIHEATHKSVAAVAWLNDLIGTLGAFLYMPGMSTTIYRYLHLDHHRYTGDPAKDPDVQYTNAPFLVCVSRWVIKDIRWGLWVARHFDERSSEEKRAFVLGAMVYVAWYTSWFLSPYATEFVLLYLIPQRIFYCVLLYFFSYVQHPVGVLQSEQPFQATVILNAPKWAQPFLMYQDKHIIHHMFPSLPFYRYPQVWTFAQSLFEQQNIPHRDVIEWNWQPDIAAVEESSLLTVIVVKEDPAISEQHVVNFCRKNLTAYKVPKSICFIDELPKSNVGKILRRELR